MELERTKLCDLLIGRWLRLKADELLNQAIVKADDSLLYGAAHLEWTAQKAEQGLILWGGRLNRCGYQSEVE